MNNIWGHIAIILFGSTILILSCAEIDPDSLEPEETFVKYYGSTKEEDIVDMVMTSDSTGVLVLGWTRATVEGDEDILVLRLDNAGNSLWQRTYSSSDTTIGLNNDTTIIYHRDVPSSISLSESNPDSAWVISTSRFGDDNEEHIHILRIDLMSGEPGLELIFQYDDQREDTPVEYRGEKVTRGADILEYDGSVIIIGAVKTGKNQAAIENDYITFMARIGINETEWSSGLFGDLSVNWDDFYGTDDNDDFGIQLGRMNDEFYMLATRDTSGVGLVYFGEFDEFSGIAEGNFQIYGSTDGVTVEPRAFTLNNSFFIVTGSYGQLNSERPFFLFESRVNITGNGVIKVIEDPDPENTTGSLTRDDEGSFGYDLVEMLNGDFYIVGSVKNHTNTGGVLKQDEVALIRVGSQGDFIDNGLRVLGSDQDDNGRAIIRTGDNKLLIGAQVGFGGDATMVSLMKVNDDAEFSD